MSDILIRGLDSKTVKRLKERAKRHGRSLQSEAKQVLEHAAGLSIVEVLNLARTTRKNLGKQFSDSTDLIRADRDR